MTQLQLLHDPVNGDAPTVLLLRNNAIEVKFHLEPDGVTCGRCLNDLRVHVWQLIDTDVTEQRGVTECEVTA